ncbi:hypothetical protein [Campylobacter rectus]|uniref:hypothetical protein n=1 Tax=Campylobacter rectus TaxID=203 RepID=UPI0028DD0860|nr:hypothetical protein [Campylobacter rectus]
MRFYVALCARNYLLAVANAVKLNFATRRRGGFKFKGGSYLVGSDRVKFINLTSNLNVKSQGEVS